MTPLGTLVVKWRPATTGMIREREIRAEGHPQLIADLLRAIARDVERRDAERRWDEDNAARDVAADR